MPAKKKTARRKSSKAPSPAQLRARKAFALAAKARSKASKKKASKKGLVTRSCASVIRNGRKVAKGKPRRRNKTIITKPKKVVVINPVKEIASHMWRREGYQQWLSKPFTSKADAVKFAESKPGDVAVSKHVIDGKPKGWTVVFRNPAKAQSTRRKYRNGYLDLVIMGHAKKTPSGWSLGGKTFKQGKGIVPASRAGYYLDRATGTVFSKKARNVAQGAYYGSSFHPYRSSPDYDPAIAGETGGKPRRTRSKKKRAAVKRAIRTATDKAETRQRKSTTSRLASRSLSRSAGILKGSGSRRQRNSSTSKRRETHRYTAVQRDRALARAKRTRKSVLLSYWYEGWAGHETRINLYAMPDGSLQQKAVKKNPSVKSIRKEFAGTLGKASQVFAPIGTPRNVAKLGKLLLIDTENATIKPTGIVYLCADSKGKLHLCGSKNVPIYSGAAQSFGRVKKLEYETAKPHLYPGQGTIQFWHKMGEESGNQPTLYADGKGGLKFRGGSYRITREGIVD